MVEASDCSVSGAEAATVSTSDCSTSAPSGWASAASLDGRATESLFSTRSCLFRRLFSAFGGKVSWGTEYHGSYGLSAFMYGNTVQTSQVIPNVWLLRWMKTATRAHSHWDRKGCAWSLQGVMVVMLQQTIFVTWVRVGLKIVQSRAWWVKISAVEQRSRVSKA